MTTPRRRRKVRIEWPTLALLAVCYGAWLISGLLIYPLLPVAGIAGFALAIALHSSLQHEALHGHPTNRAVVNEALVFLPLGLFYPYRRYKQTHLRHHADERLTDPYDDPESYYRTLADWQALPGWLRTVLDWNNTLLGRVTIGPVLAVIGFTLADAKLMVKGDAEVGTAWLLHLAGLVPVLAAVQLVFGIPAWLYALTAGWLGLSILAIRSFCEHQWTEHPDGRTIIVEKSILSTIFLNNNLHFVHHKRPTAPWYELPRLYREAAAEWQGRNGGYVFRNYLDVAKAFALRRKEPVAHPALRRDGGNPFEHGLEAKRIASVPAD